LKRRNVLNCENLNEVNNGYYILKNYENLMFVTNEELCVLSANAEFVEEADLYSASSSTHLKKSPKYKKY
jgi:hypothetical protein